MEKVIQILSTEEDFLYCLTDKGRVFKYTSGYTTNFSHNTYPAKFEEIEKIKIPPIKED